MQKLAQQVNRASTNAYKKIKKYFSENHGSHPARNFLKDIESSCQEPQFSRLADLKHVPDFDTVPTAEKFGYRILVREFQLNYSADLSIQEELQQVRDFWVSMSNKLPILAKIAETYGFAVCSSAAVERVFSYFHKLLTDDRHNLGLKTIKELMFLYINASFFC